MATTKITDLTAYTDPVNTDVLPIVDVTSDVTKKVSIANVMKNASLGSAAAPGISFDGDPNTGVYSPGADQVAVATNGTGRLFVDASGRVGVGGSPARKLHVYGATDSTLRLQSTSDNRELNISCGHTGFDADQIIGQSASLRLTANGFENLRLGGSSIIGYTSGSERLRITSAGLVGIGTSAPSTSLHVRNIASGGTDTQEVARFETNTGGSVRGISISAPGDLNAFAKIAMEGTSFPLQLWTGVPSGARLTITSTGNVGVGTTNPEVLFEVESSGSSAETVAEFGNSVISGGLQILTSGNLDWGLNARNARNLTFSTNQLERARIDSSGRLLVGTSSTLANQETLQINSTNPANVFGVYRQSNDGAGPRILLGKTRGSQTSIVQNNDIVADIRFVASDGVDIASQAASIRCDVDGTPGANDMPGRLVFSTTADGASSPTERMRITNGGQVDIGGTYAAGSDRVRLNPSSSNFSRNTTSAAAQIYFENPNGTVGQISTSGSATSYLTSSDYRLKENVIPVTDGITRLQQLKPSRFNFIADPDTAVDGFIAHEVQAVVPEAITGEKDAADDDGNPVYQGIDQSKLVPLLTAALQEAVARIEQLEAAVTALQQS